MPPVALGPFYSLAVTIPRASKRAAPWPARAALALLSATRWARCGPLTALPLIAEGLAGLHPATRFLRLEPTAAPVVGGDFQAYDHVKE